MKGERVLGLAYAHLDPQKYPEDYKFFIHPNENLKDDDGKPLLFDYPEPNFPIQDLCFVGLVAMEDPPR